MLFRALPCAFVDRLRYDSFLSSKSSFFPNMEQLTSSQFRSDRYRNWITERSSTFRKQEMISSIASHWSFCNSMSLFNLPSIFSFRYTIIAILSDGVLLEWGMPLRSCALVDVILALSLLSISSWVSISLHLDLYSESHVLTFSESYFSLPTQDMFKQHHLEWHKVTVWLIIRHNKSFVNIYT